jgi:glycosyltransferase involved in cell wall biosynthesis
MVSTMLAADHAVAGAPSREAGTPLLTVLVPAYNEAGTIEELLRRVLDAPPAEKQVVVVDDGSTDGTCEIVRGWELQGLVQVAPHDRNRGKGAAIQTGLAQARGAFTIVQDADLEYDPRDYEQLLGPLLVGNAQAVYGSRYLSTEGRVQGRWRLLRHGVSLLNLWLRLLYGVRLTDEATCYKALPTALFRALDLQCRRFEFCPEVTAKLCRLGVPIHEVPIRYHPRSKRQGKKLRLRDGWGAVRELWRWRNWTPGLAADLLAECPVRHIRLDQRDGHRPAADLNPRAVRDAKLMEALR